MGFFNDFNKFFTDFCHIMSGTLFMTSQCSHRIQFHNNFYILVIFKHNIDDFAVIMDINIFDRTVYISTEISFINDTHFIHSSNVVWLQ